jgi:hypothetical protein
MNRRREYARRLLWLVVVIVVVVVAVWVRRATRPTTIARRHPVHRRERQVAPARTNSVGILVEFVPEVPMPPGGWAMDAKLPLSVAPAWVTDPSLPYTLDKAFGTIPVRVPPVRMNARMPAAAGDILRSRTAAFAVRGSVLVENLPILSRMVLAHGDSLGLYSDPPLVSETAPSQSCELPHTGSPSEVTNGENPAPAASHGKVLIGIVDLGFDFASIHDIAPGARFDATLSFSGRPDLGAPGSSPADEHGNMCAYDATLIGSNATLLDLRVGDPKDERLSDALKAYHFLIAQLASRPALRDQYEGLVVSNSWGLWSKDDDLPPDERYFDNPNHPFTLAVRELVQDGADVLFAAGDSALCPSTGDGTIWAANSLDEVISVAAVDANKARISYSSQGPGTLAAQKPDLSAFSEFAGSDDGDVDTGTSAAAAVAAGIVAVARSREGWGWKIKSPAQLKQHLIDTADRAVTQGGSLVTLTGWTRDFGFGIARVPQ